MPPLCFQAVLVTPNLYLSLFSLCVFLMCGADTLPLAHCVFFPFHALFVLFFYFPLISQLFRREPINGAFKVKQFKGLGERPLEQLSLRGNNAEATKALTASSSHCDNLLSPLTPLFNMYGAVKSQTCGALSLLQLSHLDFPLSRTNYHTQTARTLCLMEWNSVVAPWWGHSRCWQTEWMIFSYLFNLIDGHNHDVEDQTSYL